MGRQLVVPVSDGKQCAFGPQPGAGSFGSHVITVPELLDELDELDELDALDALDALDELDVLMPPELDEPAIVPPEPPVPLAEPPAPPLPAFPEDPDALLLVVTWSLPPLPLDVGSKDVPSAQ